MKARSLALVLALVVLIGLASGCAPTGEPSGDGLHSTVPAVVGKPLQEARGELLDAGYEIGEITPRRAAASGVVSAQDPLAGVSAPRGTEIDLVVEDGR
jgi:beta-lactam-binding protein with PASTA domain